MKPNTWIAVLLIVVGFALTYQGINAVRRRVFLHIGPLNAAVNRNRVDPVTTILGVAALAGGIVLLVRATRKT